MIFFHASLFKYYHLVQIEKKPNSAMFEEVHFFCNTWEIYTLQKNLQARPLTYFVQHRFHKMFISLKCEPQVQQRDSKFYSSYH